MNTENERLAAVFHDVVEGASYTLDDIKDEAGSTIRDAVDALTKRDDKNYQEFASRAANNDIARKVKIADIEDNMDLTRLSELDNELLDKQAEYHEAWQLLQTADGHDWPHTKK